MTDESFEDRRIRDEERQRVRNDRDVIQKIMLTRTGRDWLYRFLERCHIFGSPFMGEETHKTAFAQGEENIGKQLWLDVQNASLDLYTQMIREQREEQKRLDKIRRAETKAEESSEKTEVAAHLMDLEPPEGWSGD